MTEEGRIASRSRSISEPGVATITTPGTLAEVLRGRRREDVPLEVARDHLRAVHAEGLLGYCEAEILEDAGWL